MRAQRKRRLWMAGAIVLGVGSATALVMMALRENLEHFYSPTDIAEGRAPSARTLRLGGIVLEESLTRAPESLEVAFVVTDRFHELPVRFTGILPDLFREGQSVVATGKLEGQGLFVAEQVLAKHDENYMPAEVADAIERAKVKQSADAATSARPAPTGAVL